MTALGERPRTARPATDDPGARAVLMIGAAIDAETAVRQALRAGVVPVAAESEPAAAVASAEALGADVVLADLRLGDAVPQLASALAERPRPVPVVGLWAPGTAATIADAVAAGVAAFARLEGDPEELRRAVAAARPAIPTQPVDVTRDVLDAVATRLRSRDTSDQDALIAEARVRFTAPERLQPVFQPIADLATRRTFGYLALTRFAGEPPAETGRRFAEARQLGLGLELEVAAARRAVGEASCLPDDALLVVKVSCATVASGALADVLLDEHAHRIVLELEGHAQIQDPKAFYDAVDALRCRGARFSVDETGAGFGALDHVLDLSPSFVRLAAGLTRGIDLDRTRRALALSVISFASHLGAGIVADRIETEEELRTLHRLGVHYGLGFHIGRPGPLPARQGQSGTTAVAPADGSLHDAESGTLVWARSAPRRLAVPARARHSLDDTTRAVLTALVRGRPGALAYVAHLDGEAGVMRIVDVEAPDMPVLEPGRTFPLDACLDEAVVAGDAPQTAHGAAVGPAAEMVAALGGAGWAVVPFAGTAERPMATLSMLVTAGGALTDEDVDALRDGGAILRQALDAGNGGEGEAAQALRVLAWRDRVTGLLNATRFGEFFEEANARASGGMGHGHVVHVRLANFDALAQRLGRALADLVRKDVARGLAAHTDHVDVLARVGETTFACLLFGRRASEVEYFCRAIADHVEALARRRGATADLRVGYERLGLGATTAQAWQSAGERAVAL